MRLIDNTLMNGLFNKKEGIILIKEVYKDSNIIMVSHMLTPNCCLFTQSPFLIIIPDPNQHYSQLQKRKKKSQLNNS